MPAVTATGPGTPSTVAGPGPSGVPGPEPSGEDVVPCAAAIDVLPNPPADLAVVAAAVAVPTGTMLPPLPQGSAERSLFAKSGLVVRADATVTLDVSGAAAVNPRIGWGSPADPGRRVRLIGCPDRLGWLVFPGGYWVDRPACVPLTVTVAGRTERVAVAVGESCTGGTG